ncbi:hypothetical protein [Candidatus Agathobaculum pullicola]|uniref:hypothetical protein n=1 Tax=Candidatus Agathobaculum pullicola TaxID=2838426 RepID=UPI003F912EB4
MSLIISILIFVCGYLVVSHHYTRQISLSVWPFAQSKEIENIDLFEIIYNNSEGISELGDSYRIYESGNGQLKIPVAKQAEYLEIEAEILEYANVLSNIVWFDSNNQAISQQTTHITDKINILEIPDKASCVVIDVNTTAGTQATIRFKEISSHLGYPETDRLTLLTIIFTLPYIIWCWIYFVFQKVKSIVFDPRYRTKKSVAFIYVFFIILTYIHTFYTTKYYYDAANYNALSDAIFADGRVSLSPLYGNLRGYVFPLLIALAKNIFGGLFGNPFFSYYLVAALVYAFLFSCIIPTFFEKIFGYKTSAFSCVLPSVLLLAFWGKQIIFILSDLPAAFCVLAAFLLILTLNETSILFKASVISFFIGVLTYAAYNIRTMYIFLFVLVPFIVAYKNWNKRAKFVLICLLMLLLGVLCAGMPQAWINMQTDGSYSILVNTGESGGLFTSQLQWGLSVQRYETYVGLGETPYPGVAFGDNVGQYMLTHYFNGSVGTIGAYFKQALLHPLWFVGVYFRHFINALNHCYPDTYIEFLGESMMLISVICYSLWFMLPLGGYLNYRSKANTSESMTHMLSGLMNWFKNRGIYIIAILFSSLVSIIGALEIRFFILGYILLYYYICMGIDYSSVWNRYKSKFPCIILIYALGLMVCISLWPVPPRM